MATDLLKQKSNNKKVPLLHIKNRFWPGVTVNAENIALRKGQEEEEETGEERVSEQNSRVSGQQDQSPNDAKLNR